MIHVRLATQVPIADPDLEVIPLLEERPRRYEVAPQPGDSVYVDMWGLWSIQVTERWFGLDGILVAGGPLHQKLEKELRQRPLSQLLSTRWMPDVISAAPGTLSQYLEGAPVDPVAMTETVVQSLVESGGATHSDLPLPLIRALDDWGKRQGLADIPGLSGW
jgi:hypothetical protein